jgi:hypothetical protein
VPLDGLSEVKRGEAYWSMSIIKYLLKFRNQFVTQYIILSIIKYLLDYRN